MFRQRSGINEASATAQLFQCASQSLGDGLLKSDAEIVSKPLQELLSAMRRLAECAAKQTHVHLQLIVLAA